MKRWTHPQDVVPLIAGIYAALSPMWTATTSRATTTMIVLGVVTALVAIGELVRPDLVPLEGMMALIGVAFIVAPWVMGFADTRPMAWTAWIIGAVTLVVGVADLQVTRMHHRDDTATSH